MQDEAYVRMHPTLAATWAAPGQRPVIDTWDQHQRRVLYGAVEPRTGQLAMGWMNRPGADGMLQHLEQIARVWPQGTVIVVMDNGPGHKSARVRQWFRAHPHVQPFYLPPYCPQLNGIERLWKDYRHQVVHNHRHRDVHELERASQAYHAELAADPARVRRLVRVNHASILS